MAEWVKLQTNIFSNRKMKALTDAEQLMWIKLICLAGEINDAGKCYITAEIPLDFGKFFDKKRSECVKSLQKMQALNMLNIDENDIITLIGWAEYQNVESLEKSKEMNRERQKRYYESHKKPNVKSNVRPNVSQTLVITQPNATDIEKEEDIDKDIDIYTPISPAEPNVTFSYSLNFEMFWEHYPKKKGKGDAYKSWQKIRPSDELTQVIIKAVEMLKGTRDWFKDNGKYIPLASTFLNQRRWEDDPKSYNMTTLSSSDADKVISKEIELGIFEEGGDLFEVYNQRCTESSINAIGNVSQLRITDERHGDQEADD